MTTSGSSGIFWFRILAMRSALRLECKGMRRSRPPSVHEMVKKEFGFKGTKEQVLQQLEKFISDMKRETTP